MPDYVYALHDFLPEHEDEVSFHAGERIEVVERDDLYGDGWWQGRNLAGKVGLFPQSYTTPAPPQEAPAASTSNGENGHPGKPGLQTLTEESESESPIMPNIASPVPKLPPATFLNGHDTDIESPTNDMSLGEPGDGEMMKATLTDVQKAIEQLGRNRIDGDGGRSFSFASTRDGGTESDFDLSDIDTQDEADGQDWHKGARRKLAEKARKAVEEAERLEELMGNGGGERRSTAPPIDVELSDDSDDEGDLPGDDRHDYTSSSFHRAHPHIPEEDEDEAVSSPADFSNRDRLSKQQEISAATTVTPQPEDKRSPTPPVPQVLPVLGREDTELPTATRETFPELGALPVIPMSIPPFEESESPAPAPVFVPPPPLASSITEGPPTSVPPLDTKRNSAPAAATQPLAVVPSPTASSQASGFSLSTPFQGTSISSTAPTSAAPAEVEEKREPKHPNDWSVEEVIEWLKSKGFDEDVCNKFTEQEITGDVLLELDVNVLKTEIGIPAFGKRMRIANAIAELRRPPSVSSFEPRPEAHTPSSIIHQPSIHQRSLSQTHSHHSFPGTPLYGQTHSTHSSMGSPMGYSLSSNAPLMPQPEVNETNGLPANAAARQHAAVGLGIAVSESANGRGARGRPSQLMLSPSAPSLKDKVIIEAPQVHTPEEDRAHMSDGEVVASSTSVRRRLFGRSHDSSSLSIGSRTSKDGSLAPSASTRDARDLTDKEKEPTKEKDHVRSNTVGSRHRNKRSMDGKSSDRLSIFGNTFGGSIGKGRKPPPSEDSVSDSKSNSVFSRLGGSSIRKSSSQRPSTPTSPAKKPSPIEKKDKSRNVSSSTVISAANLASAIAKPSAVEPAEEKPVERPSSEQRATLRKRTSSNPASHPAGTAAQEGNGNIRPGQSILEQVGEPDYTGWMRKKAVRYNTWKPRYFVLKGEHLYILRSNNRTETRLKGYINIHGYRVTVDETLDPGRYCFRIDHDHDKTHYFSSEEKTVIREWMKAIMKATIGRDYTRPVVSSCNIPTIPLAVAQTMNPAPRPPSPGARDATQKALRRENPHQLSSRDARVLMGLPNNGETSAGRQGAQTFFADDAASVNGSVATPRTATAPPRPSRDLKRGTSIRSTVTTSAAEDTLIDWANSHLPDHLQVKDTIGPLFSGLGLLRIAESIKGKPASPPVPDSAFPMDPADDKLDGLFRLFDFLLDNDVKMGSVSINDVRQGKRDKVLQLLRALRAWEDKRRTLASMAGSVTAGSFMAPHYGY